MSMLAELVDLVIGVDTHADTHTAALVGVESGAVLDTLTVTTDPDGYTQLVALAESHGGIRGWAIGLGHRRRWRLWRRAGPPPGRAR